MPTIITRGMLSASAFGFGATAPKKFQFDTNKTNSGITLSNNNLKATNTSASGYLVAMATKSIGDNQKIMISATMDAIPANETMYIGFIPESQTATSSVPGNGAYVVGDDGSWYASSYTAAYSAKFQSNGSVVDVCLDSANNRFWYRVNGGSWNGNSSNNPETNTGGLTVSFSYPVRFMVSPYRTASISGAWSINTTAAYGVPSGFQFIAGGES